ncbi:hypothetical protein [Methanogenium organophilum]|uniref:Uncharacterized protein n=1 Tax=Methanogenium organophilum TaxID=2199 RepID=A0A9X9S3X3_METOG|nr:hypothetical protein [Methanogenium organophilum]WAI01216.1 hypothetical protein OU421_12505 [Methanogenium organophilum]
MSMIVLLAIDALEFTLVEKFGCKNLMQSNYGKTDISEFSQPRTMVLWSSFMTGENKEEEVLALGDKDMWNLCIPHENTFFSKFENPKVIDLPGYNYNSQVHARSRELLAAFFNSSDSKEKTSIRNEYNQDAFAHHRAIKEEFTEALNGDFDFVLGYFSAIDVIGHLNFGNMMIMKMLYNDMDEIAGSIEHPFMVLSDHGMEAVGIFGDHSNYGFWSCGESMNISPYPRITYINNYLV